MSHSCCANGFPNCSTTAACILPAISCSCWWVEGERNPLAPFQGNHSTPSSERLDDRVDLDLDGFVVGRDRRDLAIDAEQLIDDRLCSPDRVFDGEDDIDRDFHELTDHREVPGVCRNGLGAIPCCPRHEHAGDVRHPTGNADRGFKDRRVEIEMSTQPSQYV